METGANISFVAFKTVVDKLQKKVLTPETFITKFSELQAQEQVGKGDGGGSSAAAGSKDDSKQIKIHADLLRYICDNCIPVNHKDSGAREKLSSDEINLVMSLAPEDDIGFIDVEEFAKNLLGQPTQ